MKLCDIAQAYHASSGGIKTYIDAKRAAARTEALEHVLIIPGEKDGVERHPGQVVHTVRSPRIPGCAPYRLLVRANRLRTILARERCDVIEVDSPYLAPWVAFSYRRRFGGAVIAFHHTDVAGAYVAPVVRRLGEPAGRLARRTVDCYQQAVYRRCDLVLAASPRLASRLPGRVATIRLGVDAEVFSPARRSQDMRARFGVAPDCPLLVYAGRLDSEKRPDLIAAAFALLPAELGAHLLIIGEGPLARSLVGVCVNASARPLASLRNQPAEPCHVARVVRHLRLGGAL